ncbi:MAG: hypothetical protein GC172_11005 [Phycisphaera sp.]|nr:hypothetical protein [Phycisphaera sp.]
MSARDDLGLADIGAVDGAAGHHHDAHGDFTVTTGSTRRRFGFAFLVLLAVVIAAVASLWSMRAIGLGAADSITQSEAGQLVESFLKERAPGATASAAKASAGASEPVALEAPRELRIPRKLLTRNPFAPSLAAAAPIDPARPAEPASAADAAAEAEAAAVQERELRISEWEALVDEGARDFLIQSTLVAANPAASLVNMNGGVYRVGEVVMFPDHPVRYEILSVALDAITLRAANAELNAERLLRLELAAEE